MFCLYNSRKLFRSKFDFSLNVKFRDSNSDYFLKSFLLYILHKIYSIFKVGNKKKSDVLSKGKGGTIELVTTQETPVTLENISSKRHVIFYFSLHKKQPEYS